MSSEDGFRFFRIHRALKMHFTTNYDVEKFSLNLTSNKEKNFNAMSEERRNIFRTYDTKIKTPLQVFEFCAVNFFNSQANWLYDGFGLANETYTAWQGVMQSFSYKVKNDYKILAQLKEKKQCKDIDLFNITPSGGAPPIIQLWVKGSISPECIIHYSNDIGLDLHLLWSSLPSDPFVSPKLTKFLKYKQLFPILSKEYISEQEAP